MTVREVYRIALSLMSEQESDATDYEPLVPGLIQIMLPELFDLNNSIRIWKMRTPLSSIPTQANMSDELVYEDEVVRGILPFGLAAKLTLDDDMSKASYFNNEYVEKQAKYKRARQQLIQDFYS